VLPKSVDGGDQSPEGEHAAAAGGEPRPVRAQPSLQHNERGDVRYLRQIRRHSPDPHRHQQGHARNGLRRLRGHLRCQNRRRSPLRLQRGESLPYRAVLSASEDEQEVRSEEEGGRDCAYAGEVWRLHQR